jgi:hypothetical protein
MNTAVTQFGSCVQERRTAGPSATLGMTKGRVALPVGIGQWLKELLVGWRLPRLRICPSPDNGC